MRILVTVKFVPDLQSQRSFTEGAVTRTGDDGTMNELDENAVEAALQLKEAAGEGEVYALTVGGDDAVAAVRKALQLGVDHAVHVSDAAIAGSDVFGTAKVIAAAVEKINDEAPLDLVITGMAALDGLTSMLPTALAAELDWAQLTLASGLTVDGSTATIVRHLPDAHETVSASLPAVVSVTDEANKPRYPNFKLIMAARSKPVTTWTLADLGIAPESVGAGAARTVVVDASPRPPKEDRTVVTDTGEGGVALADFLIERGLA
ncbi:electron transfer flavoprotein subunit beta/FixA family protein [Demequina maris]|uniref:electron transfer flavoprotein subunit beta/FixA family protein n=1 Tax=Demequina maris TaxID=1638982 RepID=UPI000781D46C|nr:electron transfer flavoprotein subunit beta/FixA family protein [Demequina maris]